MIGLIDVNVLVALLVRVHEHHDRARKWLDDEGERDGWATCALTELGAIRICAQLPSRKEPKATAEAIVLLHEASQTHVYWPDTVSPPTVADVRSAATAKQVSDRYLLGLAKRHGGRLVTFDRGAAEAGGSHALWLLPPADAPPVLNSE